MTILVTGCAGFIGMHLCKKLIEKYNVVGVDNINSYYDTNLKKKRLSILKNKNFQFHKIDITKKNKLKLIFKKNKPKIVIHLAAEVGVRNSLINPKKYINSNILGFFNILENCKENKVKKLFYASSSSVYGNSNTKSKESNNTDNTMSVYAASKKAGEVLASTYSHLYKFSIIGLRFFTVYGPYGRPDMAIFKFADSMFKNKKINVYENGKLYRDFTYIDDLIFYINKMINKNYGKKHEIYNIANSKPVIMKEVISILESATGIIAKKQFLKKPRTEIFKTFADTSKINKLILMKKKTPIKKGILNFIKWYKKYNKIYK